MDRIMPKAMLKAGSSSGGSANTSTGAGGGGAGGGGGDKKRNRVLGGGSIVNPNPLLNTNSNNANTNSSNNAKLFDDGPTSTTKAMMVSLVAPRFIVVKTVAVENEENNVEQTPRTTNDKRPNQTEEDQTVSSDTSSSDAPAAASATDKAKQSGKVNEKRTNKIATNSNEPESSPADDADVDAAESTGEKQTAKTEKSSDPSTKQQPQQQSKPPSVEDSNDDKSAVPDKPRSKEETEENEEQMEDVSPEEAAAVVVSDNAPDETEVNVEALLKVTFTKLLQEWHLLTVPTFTRTNQRLQQDDPAAAAEEDMTWVQVQVMVRPTSLAILLDRLEHIGVGTTIGSFSVYKAELCRTTNAYAQQPIEEEASSVAGKETNEASDRKVPTNQEVKVESENREATSSVAGTAGTNSKAGNANTNAASTSNNASLHKTERMIEAARMEWKNAATRLRIEQVREQISEQAAMSFDFISLLIIASILAGVGLIMDNTVVIVASMLVSPIMGPVLGLTFGSRIGDWPLVLTSLRNETLALLGCVLVGVLVGLCGAFTSIAEDTWPTTEMHIRGEASGLITGIAIAIPSGMGVCLSVLGGNTSSLVGVAISASLLPPAVNTGVCFIYSLLLAAGAVTSGTNNGATDFAITGGISFGLTALNIVCIWVSGLVMFEIKEVAPAKQKSAFWARDLKVARNLNKSSGDKPPPVNITVIKQGLKTAIEKEQKEGSVRLERHGPFLPYGPRRPDFFRRASSAIDDTFQHNQQEHKNNQQPNGLINLFGNFWAGITSGNKGDDDDGDSIDYENVRHVTDENVRYVGLEDMGTLLGFDKESEEFEQIDHLAIANRIGKGRYL